MEVQQQLPLAGIRVVELTHMVMGPSAGLILADLGADVLKVEPLEGDNTRRLRGSGAGYFPMYNRNKQSIALDLKHERGRDIAGQLLERADVVLENFRPGAMAKLGFDYARLAERNPALIYCSMKGFLSGPYAHRTALDEVVQMMGGLAYMTGLPGRPLRAGSSVIDITGGMFAVIGVLAALQQRTRTGRGQYVTSSLFETAAFMVGQHMAQESVLGQEPQPMSVRQAAWAIYDIFVTRDAEKVFVGVVSDSQWRTFCAAFKLHSLLEDNALTTNNGRVEQRARLLPIIADTFGHYTKAELMEILENSGLPFAPINRPHDLFEDPHLNANGGLVSMTLPDNGQALKLPGLPLEMAGQRFGLRQDLPAVGEHAPQQLRELGYDDAAIEQLVREQVVRIG